MVRTGQAGWAHAGGRFLKSLLLAFVLLFAQQAAQLHALAHAQDETAQSGKSRPATHTVEKCVAFHAVDSALTATAALHDFDFPHTELASWHASVADSRTFYRLPARAPPAVV
jgi:hypothetical protein